MMPVMVKLSRSFHETFGDEIANEQVDAVRAEVDPLAGTLAWAGVDPLDP
jgi:hypothetical protein